MSSFVTFYEWLEKQKGRKSPLGDLAAGAVRDENFPKDVASADALVVYLKGKKAPGIAVATARIAWQTYARTHGPKTQL
jgi:uncharacterized protein YozE (UPF0346 family)